ncbi:MAG: phosphocholine cytidylyltransferase family protein [Phycisphaerae bacterium]|nr:phosphocholine cytidylyltransferase family protein [Gemmatimonadaceae bacterium]
MNALILAAGRGTRLGLDDGTPKCLVDVGGQPLIDRYLNALELLGVPVTVVVGHAAERIASHVNARALSPTLVPNARFSLGSVVSLATGLQALGVRSEGSDVLLLDGDVAFAPSLLSKLLHHQSPNALLVDVGTVFTDEQYMAGINHNRVVALRRGPVDGNETQGEWVGFAKLSASTVSEFRAAVEEQIASGATSGGYEDALAALLARIDFTAVPTDGEPWVEIDFAADLERARLLFANQGAQHP